MTEDSFIKQIQSAPNDESSRLIYADWLEERGDTRADFLRVESEYIKMDLDSAESHSKQLELINLTSKLSQDWMEKVGYRYDLWLKTFGRQKLNACKIIKIATRFSLMRAKVLTESAPTIVIHSMPFFAMDSLRNQRWFSMSGEDTRIGSQNAFMFSFKLTNSRETGRFARRWSADEELSF